MDMLELPIMPAYEIKRGRLKKSEAKELILNSTEGKIPKSFLKNFYLF